MRTNRCRASTNRFGLLSELVGVQGDELGDRRLGLAGVVLGVVRDRPRRDEPRIAAIEQEMARRHPLTVRAVP